MLSSPPRSPPFPYTTLFRSALQLHPRPAAAERGRRAPGRPRGDRHAPVRHQSPRREPHLSAAADLSADRKSTRLNSSHLVISYAVFCLKKKELKITPHVNKF